MQSRRVTSCAVSFSSATSCSLFVICCNPPDLHRDRCDDVRDPILPPSVPQDMCLWPPGRLCFSRRAVEVCQAALVEPPSRVVVLAAAAFHSAVVDGAERITAVVVHVWGTEQSRVLVLLLLIATKRITCAHTQKCTQPCRSAHVMRTHIIILKLHCLQHKLVHSYQHCLHICPAVYWRTGFHCPDGNHHMMHKTWRHHLRPEPHEVGNECLSGLRYEISSSDRANVLLHTHTHTRHCGVTMVIYVHKSHKYNGTRWHFFVVSKKSPKTFYLYAVKITAYNGREPTWLS